MLIFATVKLLKGTGVLEKDQFVYRYNQLHLCKSEIQKYPCRSRERIQPGSFDNEPSSVHLWCITFQPLPTVTTQQCSVM